MSARSVITSAPVGWSSKPSAGAGRESLPGLAWGRAGAVHPERVAALARKLLEEVDGPVHERDHRVAGPRPPVPVALGGLVAGQRERRGPVDQPPRRQAAGAGPGGG